jgi:hypothetical protein
MRAQVRDRHARNVQRLSINATVNCYGEQFAELAYVDVGRGEARLIFIRIGSCGVLVIGQNW